MKKSNKNPDAPSSASTKASSAKDTPAKSVVAAPVAPASVQEPRHK
jgi:hypothetical protein